MISILFPDPEFKLAIEGGILSIVAIFGLIGNSLAIAVLSRPSMRSPINLILIGKPDSGTIVFTSKIVFSINEQLTIVFRAVDNCLQSMDICFHKNEAVANCLH